MLTLNENALFFALIFLAVWALAAFAVIFLFVLFPLYGHLKTLAKNHQWEFWTLILIVVIAAVAYLAFGLIIGLKVGLVVFAIISVYFLLSFPNGFSKFFCAIISLTGAYAAFEKVPTVEFVLLGWCVTVTIFYLLARLANFITRKEGGCFFKKKEPEKPQYFRF